jgi:hypothetical protein
MLTTVAAASSNVLSLPPQKDPYISPALQIPSIEGDTLAQGLALAPQARLHNRS